MNHDELNHVAKAALDAAFAVHTALGAGLLESAYCACLRYEIEKRGLVVRSEVALPVLYDGQKLADVGYRMDLLVEEELVIEVKAVEGLTPFHHAQILSYLRLSRRRLGLLINFNEVHLKDGIHRKVNGF
jgi:GxxExxY protein